MFINPFIKRMSLLIAISFSLSFGASHAMAFGRDDANDSLLNSHNWQDFSADVHARTDREQTEGVAYMITGGLGLIGGITGYFSSDDPIAKTAFSLTESLAIAGIGYGAYQYNIGGTDREFENVISNSSTLSAKQRDEILANYQENRRQRHSKSRTILMMTYGTIALANLVNASQEKDPAVRTGLYFLSGFNALGVLSLTF